MSSRLRPTFRRTVPTLLVAAPVALLLTILLSASPSGAADGRIVRAGLYENPPKVFTDESGNPAGIFVDLLEHIAREEGWTLRYVPGTWAEGLSRLASGEIDLMPDVARTAERAGRYAFHEVPVLNSWSQVYARKGSGIQSVLDLDGRRIAVLEGSVQQDAFARFSAGFGLKVRLVPVPDFKTMFETLARGDADAGVTNRFFGLTHARVFDLEDTPVMFDPSDLYFAAPPNGPAERLSAIDRHLAALKRAPDSIYYRSLKRWISEEVRFRLPQWLQYVMLTLGAVLIASVAGSALLKRQVDLRTRELAQINREMEMRILERTAELASATERAQAADRIKSAFLASMSHELRTPLNSIIGFTGILLQGLPGPLNEEQRKQLGMVQGSSRHLLALINDVLDISKIEAGQMRLSPVRFDPSAAIGKVIRTVAPLAARKGIEVRFEDSGPLPPLTADQVRFEQILLNLVNNAVKFTDAGSVTVRCAVEGADRLAVAVSDTGIGVAAEALPRLFQPFHQVDSGLARKYEGTGLGLSICRKLLDLMGGRVDVESAPGRGSTFTVRLPLSPEETP